MKSSVIAAVLVGSYLLVDSASAWAQDQWGLLSPKQRQAYHACLYEAWVEDYCHANSLDVGACIVANGGGRFPLEGRRFTDDYCWYAAQAVPPR